MTSTYNTFEVQQAYMAAAALVVVAWPAVWFLAVQRTRWLLGPEVAARWSRRAVVKLTAATVAVGLVAVFARVHAVTPARIDPRPDRWPAQWFSQDPTVPAVWPYVAELMARGLLVPVATLAAVKLWAKWAGGATTDAERRPGTAGLTAWVNAPNVVLAVGVIACGWGGYDLSPAVGGIVAALALAAFPAWTTLTAASAAPPAGEPPADGLVVERGRVLRLLEEGKVTAADAAELIAALTGSHVATAEVGPRPPLSAGQKLGLAGLAVVVVGFFLPWFSFNPAAEVARAMRQMAAAMPVPNMPVPAVADATVTVAGGDVGRGLGWVVLALSAVAAAVPVIAPQTPAAVKRNASAAAVAVGAVLVVYLMTDGQGSVGVGLVAVAVGYAVQAAGVVRQGRWAWPTGAGLPLGTVADA